MQIQALKAPPADRESLAAIRTESSVASPSAVDVPSFLMCLPFSYSTVIPNNAWMQDINDDERAVNGSLALRQFLALYHFISSRALVHLLPPPRACTLQDLVFTANLGIVLHHHENPATVVISNFSSPPRMGESEVGHHFFKAMGYDVHAAPHKFEGEAELKHLYENVYIGGYGGRSRRECFEWMEREFHMKIIKIRLTDPYLYHLDCTVFPLTRQKTLVCTEMYTREEVAAIEKHTEVIDVSRNLCLPGICNSVRLSNSILNASNIHELQPGTAKYEMELAKNRALEDLAAELGFEVNFFNLSEFLKGGAVLSCMIMHLNRVSYNFSLI